MSPSSWREGSARNSSTSSRSFSSRAAGVLLAVQGAGDGGLPLLADDCRDVVPHQLVVGPLVHGDGASSFLLIMGAGESPQAKATHWARNWSRRWGKAWLPTSRGRPPPRGGVCRRPAGPRCTPYRNRRRPRPRRRPPYPPLRSPAAATAPPCGRSGGRGVGGHGGKGVHRKAGGFQAPAQALPALGGTWTKPDSCR